MYIAASIDEALSEVLYFFHQFTTFLYFASAEVKTFILV